MVSGIRPASILLAVKLSIKPPPRTSLFVGRNVQQRPDTFCPVPSPLPLLTPGERVLVLSLHL